MTEGTVIQFRRSRRNYKPRHFIIEVEGVDSRDKAKKFVGSDVVWKSPANKELKGKIAAAHGNKGVIRAIFETGLPGQAIGTAVQITANESKTEAKPTKVKKEAKK